MTNQTNNYQMLTSCEGMDLLPGEKDAFQFVVSIGLSRAYRLIDKIAARFERRYKRACEEASVPINREWIYSTELEKDLMHKLKMGVTLVDISSSPYAARRRLELRIEARNAARKLRLSRQQSGVTA